MIQNKDKKNLFLVAIFLPIFILINHNSLANTIVKEHIFFATPIKTEINLYKIYDNLFRSEQLEEVKKELTEGYYGFHSIWKNIENFFTDENIRLVKIELEKFRNSSNNK